MQSRAGLQAIRWLVLVKPERQPACKFGCLCQVLTGPALMSCIQLCVSMTSRSCACSWQSYHVNSALCEAQASGGLLTGGAAGLRGCLCAASSARRPSFSARCR